MFQIAHLKSYEAEVTQLRGLIHEQQRALRVASRQVDQLRVSERMLSDDVSKMRTQGYTRKQQQEMEHKWEEKMQAECKRLRHELQLRAEEEQLRVIAQVCHIHSNYSHSLRIHGDSKSHEIHWVYKFSNFLHW